MLKKYIHIILNCIKTKHSIYSILCMCMWRIEHNNTLYAIYIHHTAQRGSTTQIIKILLHMCTYLLSTLYTNSQAHPIPREKLEFLCRVFILYRKKTRVFYRTEQINLYTSSSKRTNFLKQASSWSSKKSLLPYYMIKCSKLKKTRVFKYWSFGIGWNFNKNSSFIFLL